MTDGAKNMSSEWISLLNGYSNPTLRQAVNTAYSTSMVYPARENLFRAFSFFEPKDTRVVILGQDPYPQPGNACGLCFAVPHTQPVPGSLQHIFAEIDREFGPTPHDSELTSWASQGVLLLNTILSVQAGSPMSHAGFGWQTFTDLIIRRLSETNNNMVFLLWGSPAAAKASLIDTSRHLVLRSTHPSGLSWGKRNDGTRTRPDAFWGCNHFAQCNDYLTAHNIPPIRW